MSKQLRPQTRSYSAAALNTIVSNRSQLEVALPCVVGNTVIAASESYRCGDFSFHADFSVLDVYSHAVGYQAIRITAPGEFESLSIQKSIPLLEAFPSSRLMARFIFYPRTAEPPTVIVPYTVDLTGTPARTSTDFITVSGVDGELTVINELMIDSIVNLENYSYINLELEVGSWYTSYDLVAVDFSFHKIIT